MNALFERFLTDRLTHALRGRLQVRRQAGTHLDHARRIPLIPDLEFRRAGSAVFVADIKYKLTDRARPRPEDYYQLLAYAAALGLAGGVLLYCREPDGEQGSRSTVARTGTVLHLRAIDASASPEAVAAEIDDLATWIVGRAARAHAHAT